MSKHVFPIKVDRYPFYYGWIVMIVGALGMLGSIPGQPFGVSAFTDSLLDATDVSRDQLSAFYLIGTLLSALCLPIIGKIYDRIGVRKVMLTATFTLAMMQLLLSYTTEVSQLIGGGVLLWVYLVMIFFSIRIMGQGTMALVSRAMIMKWFDKKRGIANAVSGTMVSVGFSIAPSLLLILLYHYGWISSYRILALSLLVIFVLVFFFYADAPAEYGLYPDGKKSGEADSHDKQEKGSPLSLAIRTYPFWIICLVTAFCNFFIGGFTFHITSIAEEFMWSKEAMVQFFIYVTVLSVFFALLANVLSDFVRSSYILAFCMLGIVIASFGFMMKGEGIYYYVLVVGFAIFSGFFTASAAVFHPKYFGNKYLGQISGFNMLVMVVFSSISPFIFSLSKSHLGSYSWAAYLCLAISIILLVAALFVKEPKQNQ
ncbi:MFS transporter [Halosquirtibacter laminarini]|uniref:MFS transporter n=1 Tax=Halosquirtibacter laminarini TaxID=3374600 RepID=A0AC61NN51_9BACT|nr:MFS transporter [Prolixibacteraceae bacterium]